MGRQDFFWRIPHERKHPVIALATGHVLELGPSHSPTMWGSKKLHHRGKVNKLRNLGMVYDTKMALGKSYISFYDSSYSSYARSLAPRVAGRSPRNIGQFEDFTAMTHRGAYFPQHSMSIPWIFHDIFPWNTTTALLVKSQQEAPFHPRIITVLSCNIPTESI